MEIGDFFLSLSQKGSGFRDLPLEFCLGIEGFLGFHIGSVKLRLVLHYLRLHGLQFFLHFFIFISHKLDIV